MIHNCPYHNYYLNQAGNGGVGAIYRGTSYQRGNGIGSFLGGLFRTVLPLIKQGAKTVGKEALKSGAYFLGDLAENKPLKESFKRRIGEAGSNLKTKAEGKLKTLIGSGIKRKRKTKQTQKQSKSRRIKTAKRSKTDIFS